MRDLAIFSIVFGSLPFILKRPWLGILMLSWLGYMNPHRQAWGLAYDFPFSFVAAITTIVGFAFSRNKEMIWTRETFVQLLFLAWMFLTTQFAFFPDDAWHTWNKVWKIHLIVLLTIMLIKDRQQLGWLIWVIVASIGYYGIKGGIFTIATGGAYRVYGPAESFFGDNNEMALVLIMLLPLLYYLYLQVQLRWLKWGIVLAMILFAVAAIGSQSRGGLLAIVAMGAMLWLKSRRRLAISVYALIAVALIATLMPESWYERMNTIKNYEQDASAMGRINAWHTALNVAKDHFTGGGFEMFRGAVFQKYAPDPLAVHDAHSCYFEVMGEHGFIGLALYLTLGVLTWIRSSQVIARCRCAPEHKWAADLAGMIQVSMVGYAVGGAFLGLAYFDLPYHLMAMVLLAAKFTGLLEKSPAGVPARQSGPT